MMAESASAAEFLVLILTGIMGLSHLLQPAIWTRFFTALAGMGSPGVIAHALLSLWSVMIIVPFHWVWIGPGVIVTLWGWALLAKAVFGLCLAPDIALSSLSGRTDRDFRLAGALQLAVAGAAGWALVW